MAGIRGRIGKMASLFRSRRAELHMAAFRKQATGYAESIEKKIRSAKAGLKGMADEKGAIRHQSTVPDYELMEIEHQMRELTFAVFCSDTLLAKQRMPKFAEQFMYGVRDIRTMQAKIKELRKEHGTVSEGMGRKYYIEFLVNERIPNLIKKAEANVLMLRESGRGGEA